MNVGDKVQVRYIEMPKILSKYASTAIKVGSEEDRIEMREVTRQGEVLSLLSADRVCVRFEDGSHRVCRWNEIA